MAIGGRRAFLLSACLVGTATAHGPVVLRYRLDVPATSERQVCEYLELPLGRPGETLAGYTLTVRTSSRRATSHHAAVYDATDRVPIARGQQTGGPGVCVDQPMATLAFALTPRAAFQLPPGIRLPWHTPQAVVVDLHAVNSGRRPARVTLVARFRLRPRAPDDRVAFFWIVSTDAIAIPPFTTATVAFTPPRPAAMALLLIGGHMHARGLSLTATLDGAPWYTQRDWRHPPLVRFDPPLDVTGRRLDVACIYDNGVTRPVRTCDGAPCPLIYGPLADDAMCLMAGYAITP